MTRNEILDTLSDFRRNKAQEYHLRKLGLFGSAAREQIGPQRAAHKEPVGCKLLEITVR